MPPIEIIDITENNILDYGICSYKNSKTPGFNERVSWITDNFNNGLKIKAVITQEKGMQGFIEYIPGEFCWRPVDAKNYTFIHCLFVGYKKQFKDKGYASMLIDECIRDAKRQKKDGVAVVTRESSFMVGSKIFSNKGFVQCDNTQPDFELMVLKFKRNAALPKFKGDWGKKLDEFKEGLTIIRADQCPYTVKNVNEIKETAQKYFGIEPKIIELKSHKEAQNTPCAFGTFCIIYKGEVISYHPISNTRFTNIMNSKLN